MKSAFLFLLCFTSILSQAQIYDFPIKPGTGEWKSLLTEKERFEAMQIPENLLKSMSTYDLIMTCMNYPAMGYFTAFNNPQSGMDVIIRNFNGLQELMNRGEAPTALLSIYKQMDTKTMKIQNQAIDQTFWSIKRCYFEFLLTQNDIIDKMNSEDQYSLMEEAREKINCKFDYQEEYSTVDYIPTLLIMSKVLSRSTSKNSRTTNNEIVDQFIATGSLVSPSTAITVLELSDNYLNSKKE